MICLKCAKGAYLRAEAAREVLDEHARYLRARAKDFHDQCVWPASCTCQHREPLTVPVQP